MFAETQERFLRQIFRLTGVARLPKQVAKNRDSKLFKKREHFVAERHRSVALLYRQRQCARGEYTARDFAQLEHESIYNITDGCVVLCVGREFFLKNVASKNLLTRHTRIEAVALCKRTTGLLEKENYMTINGLLSLSLGIGIGLASATAQTSPTPFIKTVVLVHGAWADGSSWSKVIPRLTAAGLNVVAVQNPLTSLADDVAATSRAIALLDGPVLLVAHSYGGSVITEAGNDPKVAGLVFVAANAPDAGESSFSLATANPTPVGSQITTPDTYGYLKLTRDGIEQDFAQDLSLNERNILFSTQIPTAAAALGAPASSPAWKNRPTWFVVAGNDRVISPQLEAREAARMNAATITLNTSHVAMLAQPEKVAEFIKSAVDKLNAR